jgi:hypothetical protein
MSNLISRQQKLESIASQCKDVALMNSMIERYQYSTKNAVENILNMCIAVSEISKRYKSHEINEFDLIYFCSQVGLDRKSPTFRKYRQIGDHAQRFVKHMNTLPSAYTVLFQITTLDPDKFEELINSNQITPSLSLEKLKEITNSAVKKQSDPNEVYFSVAFNIKDISDETKKYLQESLETISKNDDLEIIIPKRHIPAIDYAHKFQKSKNNRLPMK